MNVADRIQEISLRSAELLDVVADANAELQAGLVELKGLLGLSAPTKTVKKAVKAVKKVVKAQKQPKVAAVKEKGGEVKKKKVKIATAV
jgi:hypothetical protein